MLVAEQEVQVAAAAPVFAVWLVVLEGRGMVFILCMFGVSAACFLQVYDRDGNQLAHFVKGDPYLKVCTCSLPTAPMRSFCSRGCPQNASSSIRYRRMFWSENLNAQAA